MPNEVKTSGLTLAAYQDRAIITAEPRAFHLDYLIPGIIGEIGELFGQRAKSYWHEWPAEKLQEELVNEYGDICWMTALLLTTYNVRTLTPAVPDTTRRIDFGPRDRWTSLLAGAISIKLNHQMELEGISETEDWTALAAEKLWRNLRDNCFHITGVEFQVVLEKNLAKLADRAARGVLRGQGDHR